MIVSIFQKVVWKDYFQRFAGDYSTTDYVLDLWMLVFLESGVLIINASPQEVIQSLKKISIPVVFLNNSIKFSSSFSLSHDTTKLF